MLSRISRVAPRRQNRRRVDAVDSEVSGLGGFDTRAEARLVGHYRQTGTV